MFEALTAHLGGLQGPLTALLQVLMIDLVLAGDNAVAVGLAAGGLPPKERRRSSSTAWAPRSFCASASP